MRRKINLVSKVSDGGVSEFLIKISLLKTFLGHYAFFFNFPVSLSLTGLKHLQTSTHNYGL